MICLTPNLTKVSLSTVYKVKKQFLDKVLFKEKGCGGLSKKGKEGFLIALASVIKKNPNMSIRKHRKELKIQGKTVRTAIIQNLNSDLISFEYTKSGVLENKTNSTFHHNIGPLQTFYFIPPQ